MDEGQRRQWHPTPVLLPGKSHGWRSLGGCSPWGQKESDMIEQLHFTTLRVRWPKYWSFSFSIVHSKEIPGLISFRMDWLDLLAVRGTLKTLLQHHSSKASILRHSAFFTVQLSHPYMTTGKTRALTRRTLIGTVMSLLLNMLSRLVITFLPRSKRLNFMAAITICSDFGAPKNKHFFKK